MPPAGVYRIAFPGLVARCSFAVRSAPYRYLSSLPAEVLGQRPDGYNAARELAAASFEVGSARAQRYPRLSIGGSVARNWISSRGLTQNYDTWSLGPISLTVPLYEGGAADANEFCRVPKPVSGSWPVARLFWLMAILSR